METIWIGSDTLTIWDNATKWYAGKDPRAWYNRSYHYWYRNQTFHQICSACWWDSKADLIDAIRLAGYTNIRDSDNHDAQLS